MITCERLLDIDDHHTPAVERAARIARQASIPVTVDVDALLRTPVNDTLRDR